MIEPVYQKHIFVCINQRVNSPRKSCGEQHGLELVAAFKKSIAEKLNIRTRAQKAGCMDICDFGPTVAVYPEGVFYVNVQLEDVEEIVQSHIVGNKPVERLLLSKVKK